MSEPVNEQMLNEQYAACHVCGRELVVAPRKGGDGSDEFFPHHKSPTGLACDGSTQLVWNTDYTRSMLR